MRSVGVLSALCVPLLGCASAQTTQHLDQSYRLASVRIQASGADSDALPDLAEGVDRDALVALVVARSPVLAAAAHRARSMIHSARAEGSLPSGELAFQAWNLPLTRPYAVGEADMYMLELRQRFPARGAVDARARALDEEAGVVLAELASLERETAQRAADSFADYVQGQQNQQLYQRHLVLLEQMQHAVMARFTTGGSGLADAARVELEIAKARRAIARTEGDIARARAAINALLRRAVDAPLGPPRAVGSETVRLSLDDLMRRARGRGASLVADARVRASGARKEAAEADASTPEFTLGLGYWQDPARRPGIGASASMSLPWLWGPQASRLDEAKELEASELSVREGANVELQLEVSRAHAQLVASDGELIVVHGQAVPAARRSIDAVRAAYTTGGASLLEWVDATRSVLDLELEETALGADLAHAVAALERAVGSPLPREPVLPTEQP